jgi:hypothetical protein
MRRALAITIVLLFSFSLAAPLFAIDAATGLPECCRRSGLHHCAAGMIADPATREISASAPKCPNWPKSTPASWPNDFASSQANGVGAALYAHPESLPQSEARYRLAFTRSRQKRGPPAAIAS